MGIMGSVMSAFSPANLLFAHISPASWIPSSLNSGIGAARITLFISAIFAGATYAAISYGMHMTMKRSFMMTVRRLAGTK